MPNATVASSAKCNRKFCGISKFPEKKDNLERGETKFSKLNSGKSVLFDFEPEFPEILVESPRTLNM